MNIDIDGLQAFVRIAEHGSFHQAAQVLSVSQPALSRRMRNLESKLGVKLLDRTTRRVTLTSIGRDFIPHARRLIHDLEQSLIGLKDKARRGIGQVIFACIPTAARSLLPDLLREFSDDYPETHIRILDYNVYESVQAVLRGEAEFAVAVIDNKVTGIDFEPLFEDPFVIACAPHHPLAARKHVRWSELKRHQLITVGNRDSASVEPDFMTSQITGRGLRSYEVQRSFWTGLRLAEAGLGIIAVPSITLPRGRNPSLVGRPLVNPALSRTIGIIRRLGTSLSPAASNLVGLMRNRWVSHARR